MERSFADFYEHSRLSKAKGAFTKFGLWLWGAIGLAGIIAAYLGSVATEILPAPRDLVCLVKEQFHDRAPGTQFTILISNLAGDSDGRQTRLVRDVFLNEHGLDVRQTCRVVTLDAVGRSVADAAAGAIEEGRALLIDWHADLLIWGEVKKADQELNLWFLGSGEGTLGAPSYSLTEKLTLPEDFETDLGAQLVAVAAAAVAPATEEAGTYLVDLLQPVTTKLEELIGNPPAGLGAENIADLYFSLGLANLKIGEQSGERQRLEEAVIAFRAVLEERTREHVPLAWAATQNNLGIALLRLGEGDTATTRLEEAVVAHRAALEELARDRVPLQWGSAQMSLGSVLLRLGERENGTDRLQEAVAAYRAALEELTRERVPLLWADSQKNLGAALAILGRREGGTGYFVEAVSALRASLDEFTLKRAPLRWAEVQMNLAGVLILLAERETDTSRLEEAITIYRAALLAAPRERFPLQWGMTQWGLGIALQSLGDRKNDISIVGEAILAYRAALEVFREGDVRFYVQQTEGRLDDAEALLARLRAAREAR